MEKSGFKTDGKLQMALNVKPLHNSGCKTGFKMGIWFANQWVTSQWLHATFYLYIDI